MARAGAAAGIGAFDPRRRTGGASTGHGHGHGHWHVGQVAHGPGRAGLGHRARFARDRRRLGGHCETYTDPATGLTTDLGVVDFHDPPIVRANFIHSGVNLTADTVGSRPAPVYTGFRTGEVVAGRTPPDPTTAFEAYYGILQKYPYLADTCDLPHPVPSELSKPWANSPPRTDSRP